MGWIRNCFLTGEQRNLTVNSKVKMATQTMSRERGGWSTVTRKSRLPVISMATARAGCVSSPVWLEVASSTVERTKVSVETPTTMRELTA